MPTRTQSRTTTGRTFGVLAGLVALVAIGFLTLNVSREIRLLGSASSDNVQWSLSQTEVEFLEFSNQLARSEEDLRDMRRRFDVFYSRITTVSRASVFDKLRSDKDFTNKLDAVLAYLDESVGIIDADDTALMAQLPELRVRTDAIRPVVRSLSNSGLQIFAENADDQRRTVVQTMTQLAVAMALLIGALTLVVLYLNWLINVTTRRERLQKQTATRLNTVIGTSLDGVIVANAEGEIMEFSPAAEAIFGHRSEDVLGRDIGEVIVPDHLRDAHEAGMERMRSHGEKRVVGKGRVTLEAKHADGAHFPVELAIQSATTDEGEIFIAFLRDISHRVASEAELVAARDKALAGEQMKTDFLATMSHEIRTPLNGLLGNMDLLRDTPLSDTQDRYMRNMETSGRLLMSHISDVLDITRYDAGMLSTKSEPVNISALLQDIIDSQSSMASANETSLEWGWDGPAQSWVESDPDRLQHILLNLVGNAVKFTKRGKVTLTARAEQDGDLHHVVFAVKDTGPGITEDLAARVFDDFVTGNTAYDRDVGGTGLGLSIAKRFVSALNGEIGVDSTVGVGSTFWVRLPVKLANAPDDTANVTAGDARFPKLKVLLVEDNEINRTVAREMLEADGHVVAEAHDGMQGVHMAQNDHFDLILMDISMPVMDGRTATRKIRAGQSRSSGTRILALTANAMADERQNFIADGMNGVLTKPLSKAALRQMIHGHSEAVAPVAPGFVDLSLVSETREVLGGDAFAKLLARFSAEVEELLEWLREAEAPDRVDIASRAHKIAGSAAVYGAKGLREHLKQLETAAESGETVEIMLLIKQLPDVWAATRAALI